jgi:hypothetical protein
MLADFFTCAQPSWAERRHHWPPFRPAPSRTAAMQADAKFDEHIVRLGLIHKFN